MPPQLVAVCPIISWRFAGANRHDIMWYGCIILFKSIPAENQNSYSTPLRVSPFTGLNHWTGVATRLRMIFTFGQVFFSKKPTKVLIDKW